MYDDDISSKKKSVGVHIHIMHVPISMYIYPLLYESDNDNKGIME